MSSNKKTGNFLVRESGLTEYLIVWVFVKDYNKMSYFDPKVSAFATLKHRNKFKIINPMNLSGHNKLFNSFYCLEGMKNAE